MTADVDPSDDPLAVVEPEVVGSWLVLLGLEQMGPRRLRALTATVGPVEVVSALRARRWPPGVAADGRDRVGDELRARWAEELASVDPLQMADRHAGLSVDLRGGPGWPARLDDDPDPPPLLVRRGRAVGGGPTVGIVGTRRCTPYGREQAAALGRELTAAGVRVVSGLALGIDGAAHRGALAVDGAPPIGVVAGGLDIVYPPRHRSLWNQVAGRGTLLTEWPLGAPALTWRFPARNRIIAALSDVVVVVESHVRGGSLHTVTAALDRGVPVMAVPGPVTSPASEGALALLVDGAAPCRGTDDVLDVLGLSAPAPTTVTAHSALPAPADATVLDAVDATPTSLDSVVLRTGRPVTEVTAVLHRLLRSGHVRTEAGWWYRAAG